MKPENSNTNHLSVLNLKLIEITKGIDETTYALCGAARIYLDKSLTGEEKSKRLQEIGEGCLEQCRILEKQMEELSETISSRY